MPKRSETTFTKGLVMAAKPKASRYELRDTGQPGLILRVYPSGRKMYIAQLERGLRRTIEDATLITVTNARARARDMLAAHGQGETPESRRQKRETLKKYLEGTYTDWAKQQNRYGERDTRRLVSALGDLTKKKLNELSQLSIENWKRKRSKAGKAPATINRELAHLKAALARAVEWNLLPSNPAATVKPLKNMAGHRVRYLSKKERKKLEKAMDARTDYFPYLVRLTLQTGLRRGEVFLLEWKDINFSTRVLTVHARNAKSGKDRHIPMNKTACSVLQKWRMKSGSRSGLVFPNEATQAPLRDIKKPWATLTKAAKVKDFRFHDCRHDFASRLVMAGIDLYRVKELLGHSSIEITQRYAHLAPTSLQEAVDSIS